MLWRLPLSIGYERYLTAHGKSLNDIRLAGCFCALYGAECTCYSLQSERIYTYQNEMEDLQMSRDWTKEELHTASEVMKQNGDTEFEEFWHALEQK